ncbi:YscQ/HrcQ family type III secretion apparatus protein [Salmonella enterica subsp. houtenae]|uniref:Surface presentation of antigens protein SpaO n=1 Tax=Salmonella houtenae TaxID=59205 RepID=A0A5Y2SDT3_SALHO|nr:YscQ/HrcQ family type III secretion apparatus protein [Salmonella enterica subsp. houtenae]QKT18200.1 YscQ/HrcQ family type III secretion apparatus protein [Salmonella enterica]
MSLRVRQIDRREWLLAQTAAECQRNGQDATLEYPTRQGMWVRLSDSEKRWSAWIKPGDWLEHVSPALAGAAVSAGAEHLVVPWFAATERPFELPVPYLSYRRLCVETPVSGSALPEGKLLHMMSDRGGLWFEHLPELPTAGGGRPKMLRWPLRCVIGSSDTQRFLLSRIGIGDVLLIRTSTAEVYCYTKKLGHFNRVEGGIIVETLDIQHIEEEKNEAETADILPGLNHLPVKLEFVLYRKNVTLAELEAIGQQQLLSLPVNAELNVEIMANGVLLGNGELVQMNDTLGVEIHEWLSESGNGE